MSLRNSLRPRSRFKYTVHLIIACATCLSHRRQWASPDTGSRRNCFVPAPPLDSAHGTPQTRLVGHQVGQQAASYLGCASGLLVGTHPSVAQTAAGSLDLFGFSSAQLFPISNISLITWLMLVFLPGWEYTKSAALVAPIINALLYAFALVFILSHPPPDAPPVDFGSLAGIVTAFRNPDGVFAGWLHYCVFDPLVGLGEVLDSQEQKVPHWLVVPCLFLTLLFGPVGFLSYLAVRTVTLLSRKEASS